MISWKRKCSLERCAACDRTFGLNGVYLQGNFARHRKSHTLGMNAAHGDFQPFLPRSLLLSFHCRNPVPESARLQKVDKFFLSSPRAPNHSFDPKQSQADSNSKSARESKRANLGETKTCLEWQHDEWDARRQTDTQHLSLLLNTLSCFFGGQHATTPQRQDKINVTVSACICTRLG